MTERRLILPGSLVRAILSGNKNQHRVPVRLQNCWLNGKRPTKKDWEGLETLGDAEPNNRVNPRFYLPRANIAECILTPRIQVGDRFWLGETWKVSSVSNHYLSDTKTMYVAYRANSHGFQAGFHQQKWNFKCSEDGETERKAWGKNRSGTWRSSIHMPRWASRLTLKVTAIRAERLQDISAKDAEAEGIYPRQAFLSPCFTEVWDSLNAKHPWISNPPVWVYELKRLEER